MWFGWDPCSPVAGRWWPLRGLVHQLRPLLCRQLLCHSGDASMMYCRMTYIYQGILYTNTGTAEVGCGWPVARVHVLCVPAAASRIGGVTLLAHRTTIGLWSQASHRFADAIFWHGIHGAHVWRRACMFVTWHGGLPYLTQGVTGGSGVEYRRWCPGIEHACWFGCKWKSANLCIVLS